MYIMKKVTLLTISKHYILLDKIKHLWYYREEKKRGKIDVR